MVGMDLDDRIHRGVPVHVEMHALMAAAMGGHPHLAGLAGEGTGAEGGVAIAGIAVGIDRRQVDPVPGRGIGDRIPAGRSHRAVADGRIDESAASWRRARRRS